LAGWGIVGWFRHRRVLADYDRGVGT
jgi:hypothetical protein